jgi:hypothetical protein
MFLTITLTISTFAQKKITKRQPVSPDKVAKLKAQKWFRDMYVATTFKDPYSYKLLKCTIVPISYLLEYQDNLEQAKESYKRNDTSGTSSVYKGHVERYNLNKADYEKARLEHGDDAYVTKEAKGYMDKYYLLAWEDSTNFSKAVRDKAMWTIALGKLSSQKRNRAMYYYVDIDCYGSNSYGAKILGRYTFKFDGQNIIGDVSERE